MVVTALLFFFPATSVAWDDSVAIPTRFSVEVQVSSAISDSLELRLAIPAQVPHGEPVPITLHVRNTTDRRLDLYLRGRTIAFDLVVTGPDGTEVWRRLADEMIPAIIRVETLQAGEALALEHTWDQHSNGGNPVSPGSYLVRGELLTDQEPILTKAQPLRIRPG